MNPLLVRVLCKGLFINLAVDSPISSSTAASREVKWNERAEEIF